MSRPSPPHMLLVGSRALQVAGLLPLDTTTVWDLWVTEKHLRDDRMPDAASFQEDAGDRYAVLKTAGGTYTLRVIPEGDVRQQFMIASRGGRLQMNAEGWSIRVASPASIRLIRRALLYSPTLWHRNIERYHCIAKLTEKVSPTPEEQQAYEALRANVIARLDGRSSGKTMLAKKRRFLCRFQVSLVANM